MSRQRRLELTHDSFSDLCVEQLSKPEADQLIRRALTVLEQRHRPGQVLSSPEDTRAYLRLKLGERKAEVFGIVFLDNRHRIIADELMFQGTIDGASVHPRIVVQRALEINAAATLLYHNHPSGVAEPSMADETLTRRLKTALALVDIRVLDHLVVSAGESVSFAEKGLL
ncbi:MAG: DNA repair protein RadC [bacterium]|nr:DNA repair protein RadC [bacterium]